MASCLRCYPPETLAFDASDIPDRIKDAFEEAIVCHAHDAYTASAIMVRKTLEELCFDQKATGENLYKRIEALNKKVLLPVGFLEGLHDLRLFGNDAAHFENRVYEQVGKEEVEVAIEVTQVILKATYQYSEIMGRMSALKKSQQSDQPQDQPEQPEADA